MIMANVVISQDIKMLINQLGAGRVQINIVQNNSTMEVQGGKSLWEIFCALPEPRMESLKLLLARELVKNIPNHKSRCSFAGISRQTLYDWMKDIAGMDQPRMLEALPLMAGEGNQDE